MLGSEPYRVAGNHPISLEAFQAALHTAARSTDEARQLRRGGPPVLAQLGQEGRIDRIRHFDYLFR
jgi:hypothetical protein